MSSLSFFCDGQKTKYFFSKFTAMLSRACMLWERMTKLFTKFTVNKFHWPSLRRRTNLKPFLVACAAPCSRRKQTWGPKMFTLTMPSFLSLGIGCVSIVPKISRIVVWYLCLACHTQGPCNCHELCSLHRNISLIASYPHVSEMHYQLKYLNNERFFFNSVERT